MLELKVMDKKCGRMLKLSVLVAAHKATLKEIKNFKELTRMIGKG